LSNKLNDLSFMEFSRYSFTTTFFWSLPVVT
jgi:hypothetical protein